MSLEKLKSRIKNNEGYSNKAYKDQLGYYTIGYGHLIKKNETRYLKGTYSKEFLTNIFEIDFKKALENYRKFFYKKNHNNKDRDLLVEMIFQLGLNGVLKFKKLLFYLNKKQIYMTCFEMMNSLWYKQTPKRVENLIKNYTNALNEKRFIFKKNERSETLKRKR